MVFVDSDILIEISRGRDFAMVKCWLELSEAHTPILFSPVSSAELWAGVRPSERDSLQHMFSLLACFPITESVGKKAGEYLRMYSKSHRLQVPDSLIAASAFTSGAALWTRNRKHYPMQDISFFHP